MPALLSFPVCWTRWLLCDTGGRKYFDTSCMLSQEAQWLGRRGAHLAPEVRLHSAGRVYLQWRRCRWSLCRKCRWTGASGGRKPATESVCAQCKHSNCRQHYGQNEWQTQDARAAPAVPRNGAPSEWVNWATTSVKLARRWPSSASGLAANLSIGAH